MDISMGIDFENLICISVGMEITSENGYGCGYSYTRPKPAPRPSLCIGHEKEVIIKALFFYGINSDKFIRSFSM